MEVSGRKLSIAMAEACMTVKELSEKAGITDQTLQNVLKDRKKPNFATIGKIAHALGVPVTDIIKD